MILAGIDIGTNTIRLLVAEAGDAGYLREVSSGRMITRLGEGLDRTSILSADAQTRSLGAIIGFVRDAREQGAAVIEAVGTSALRMAKNKAAFLASVRDATGVNIRVISGAEEARLTFMGVMASFRTIPDRVKNSDAVVLDIGGGSTEVIARIGAEFREESLPLGAVYLTERFIHHDPPLGREIDALRDAVRSQLADAPIFSTVLPSLPLFGTAGTITTLAAIDQSLDRYDPSMITGYALSRDAVSRLIGTLSTLSLSARRDVPGLEQGREDIVLAGALVVEEIMKRCGAGSMIVSDWGLREGILLDIAHRMRRGESTVTQREKTGSEKG